MDNYKMCINCLSSYEADKEACPFCGNANKNTNPNGALAVGTVLGGRYTVGNFVEIDGEGVIYTGVNNVKKSKVLIKEYMPVTLCAGRNKDGSILPKPESEVLFKTSMMDFTEVYRTLINLNGDESLSAVEDIISANGTAYAVTEFVEGIDLEEYLDQFGGSLDWRDAMAMLEPLFITIEKLHRLNWVHLGICPSNIIVNEDGVAKLVGYATQGLRTQNSEIKATLYPGYSAPEQYSVTEYKYASTDIYALGAVLYRTITGRRPTSARDREREDTLPQVAQLTNVPRYVAAAINCALRLRSAERFTNVEEFREALANVGQVKTAPKGFNFADFFNKDNKMLLYISAAVLAVIIIIFALWMIIKGVIPKPDDSSDISESQSMVAPSPSASASGEDFSKIPKFIGKKYQDVLVDYTMYKFVMEEEYSSEFKAGEIISQNPMAGSTYTKDSVITLKVSKGVEEKKVPNIIGLTVTSAENELKAQKIRYTIMNMANDGTYEEGVVIKTDKPAGTVLDIEKDTLTIYVAGPKPTPVPTVAPTPTPTPTPTPEATPAPTPTPSDGGQTVTG